MSNQILQPIIESSSDQDLIKKAFEFAESAHQGQKRFSGKDYISHPLRVAQILHQIHLDSNTIAAGLLHDVVDDTSVSLEEIQKEFGKEISFLVEGVSKVGKLRYPKQNLDLKPIDQKLKEPIDFQAENLRKMFFAMAEDLRVILIKLADRLHNMETLNAIPHQKQKRIALETMEIFAPLANRLGMGEIKGQLEDLAFPYLYPKEFEWLKKNVKQRCKEREKYLMKVKPTLIEILEKEKIIPIDVHFRAKNYWSFYQKLLRHNMNFDQIYDLVALRVILQKTKTCYQALGALHGYWKPLPERIKDYIAFPKPNGYRALHTTCFCLDGKIIEIQLKTSQMHHEAERGICAHWAAKEGVDLKTQGKKFAWVAQLSNWQKEISEPKEFLEGLKFDFFKNRIFVFTPKGDIIDLPEGACAIDFAYAVHTEVGNRCTGAKVNGKMSSLSQILKNGDVVEILLDKNRKPSRDWLEFVKTGLARSRIKEWLRKEALPVREKKMPPGLRSRFSGVGPGLRSFIPRSKASAEDGRFGGIGSSPSKPTSTQEKQFYTPPRIKKKSGTISLAGKEGILINLAKCCLPRVGDKILAYITKNRGASIHKIDCKNLIQAQKKWPQKIIQASWKTEKIYPVSLKIKAEDRIGLLKDTTSAISKLGMNILNCKAQFSQKGEATIITEVEISAPEELEQLFNQLRQVRGVIEVKKV